MADRGHDKGDTIDWTQFWDQAQQQSWEIWSRIARQAAPPPKPQPDALWSLWSDGLERLWQGRGAQLSGTSQDVFGRLVDQGKGFLFLSHELLRALEGIQNQPHAETDWRRSLRESIDSVQDQLRRWSGLSAGQTALWGLPVEMWERLAGALSLTPGDWAQHLQAATDKPSGADMQGFVPPGRWPALGIGREWQLHTQEGIQLAESCQEAWQSYAVKLLDVGLLSLDYLYDRLVEAAESGQRIRQLRTVYDLWVDAAEQAYGEVVGTPEFPALQAELINTAVALKRHLQDSMEATARANSLPTRSELDSAHRAIKDMRAELEALRAQLESVRTAKTPNRRPGKDRKK